MDKIVSEVNNVGELLGNARFSVDYYQRDYRWETKQIVELINDLTRKFLDMYETKHDRDAINRYGHYFLGSIVVSKKEGHKFIIDGQQRLTSLTLILIYLYHQTGDDRQKRGLANLINSYQVGKYSYNLDIPEREKCMDALFNNQPFDDTGESESVVNMISRFQDIKDSFTEALTGKVLPYFADWMTRNVYLIEIIADSDEEAYTIFETMNDRGLPLTPTDMLKGYLLSKIENDDKRNSAVSVWRESMENLRRIGKEEDADAVKAWLRAKYSRSIRARQRASENRDFEQIGTGFHRWVKTNAEDLGLNKVDGSFQFIQTEMQFYTRQFVRLRRAAETPIPGLEPVYHVAMFNFTLQYPMLLAPLSPKDPPDVIDAKIRTVARFLDILLARRAVNYLSMNVSAMNYTMFPIIRDMRNQGVKELVSELKGNLDGSGCFFDGTSNGQRAGMKRFGLNQWSKRYIKALLARMTHYIEQESEIESSLDGYLAQGKYEIEHIWANHYSRHRDEFDDPTDFSEYRNRIGGLLLLSKSHNASFNDTSYEKKRGHYYGQNLLAQSLHEMAYQKNPGFLRFNDELYKKTRLRFEPHSAFKKADLDARQKLYQAIAEQIWNPENLRRELED